jgi:hypothetical protein
MATPLLIQIDLGPISEHYFHMRFPTWSSIFMIHVKAWDQHQYQQLGTRFHSYLLFFVVARLAVTWCNQCRCGRHLNVGERPYLTTKIITLSEFFNFVHQVSRL